MQTFTQGQLAEIAKQMTRGMTEAGFTGVTIARAEMPQATFDALMEEDDEEDTPSLADFSVETVYHRVKCDQGEFGLWLSPYPTLDLNGLGVDIGAFYPDAPAGALPAGWAFVGMEEDVFKKLFGEISRILSQP